jgi:hypothetical protein
MKHSAFFRCHVRGGKNSAEIFGDFSVSTEICAVGSTEAISPSSGIRL